MKSIMIRFDCSCSSPTYINRRRKCFALHAFRRQYYQWSHPTEFKSAHNNFGNRKGRSSGFLVICSGTQVSFLSSHQFVLQVQPMKSIMTISKVLRKIVVLSNSLSITYGHLRHAASECHCIQCLHQQLYSLPRILQVLNDISSMSGRFLLIEAEC